MNPLFELTKTRLREFVREKGAVFWVFGFPLLMAIGLGLAFRHQPEATSAIAVTESVPGEARAALEADRRISVLPLSDAQAQRALRTAKVDLVLDYVNGSPKLHLDPTRDGTHLARLVVDNTLQRAAGRRDPLEVQEAIVNEPGGRYIDFLLPGLIGLNLMGSSMWGVGYNLVVARKRRLLRRYAVTPMRRSHFLLSYFFSRSLFLLLELAALVAFGALVFDTEVRGDYPSLLLMSFVGAGTFAAISLLIGAHVDNTEAANGWMNFAQLPMWLLSGAFFSYERFPEWLHEPIRLLPLTALIDGLRAIVNDGSSVVACWSQLLVLAAWASLGFAISLATFRWQ